MNKTWSPCSEASVLPITPSCLSQQHIWIAYHCVLAFFISPHLWPSVLFRVEGRGVPSVEGQAVFPRWASPPWHFSASPHSSDQISSLDPLVLTTIHLPSHSGYLGVFESPLAPDRGRGAHVPYVPTKSHQVPLWLGKASWRRKAGLG